MNVPNPQHERFILLLDEIRQKVDLLRKENHQLAEENRLLKKKLEEQKHRSEDRFSDLEDSERIALKHQINGLIAKIDQHLEA